MTLALESIRILDLTRLLPGPFSTMLLADYGAEVIKIEDTDLGDYARVINPKIGGDSAIFHSINRNKKSICIDLKTEKGKEIFLQLVEKADVVVESFRPGVMDRLGIGYSVLKKINPRLIYCAVTGYGQTGPYSKKPGHDLNFISYAGVLEYFGVSDRKPIVPSVQIADIGGGALMSTIGILIAIYERERSGVGQFIDVSMMDGVLSWLQVLLPAFLVTKEHQVRGQHDLFGRKANYEVYETKDGLYLSVGATELKFWEVFCTKVGREDFFQKINAPTEVQDFMKVEIQSIIIQKTRKEWIEIFDGVETCVSPVNRLEDLEEDPHVIERNMIQIYKDAEVGEVKLISPPIKLSKTPGSIRKLAPKSGEHTKELLLEIGYSEEQIDELASKHIIKREIGVCE
ncbi:CaiB/BaiF CoA-transferase family protein [Bacillus sp. AFS088145]|uniref:CaiB/BaiF CoA transferase family protein n=1 Tax=Bacillus sp. AFS088145 TaxID=2033514 RepID=UPI000BF46DCA|nr:CaiB/BaiF CoA-transferase family protein [Bacillus sp. AFS088145]PFH87758.1 carnitine dehydratase [Bacillus sp. AFS088145]